MAAQEWAKDSKDLQKSAEWHGGQASQVESIVGGGGFLLSSRGRLLEHEIFQEEQQSWAIAGHGKAWLLSGASMSAVQF